MAMSTLLLLLLASSEPASSEPASSEPEPGSPGIEALIPPEPLVIPEMPYPAHGAPLGAPVTVVVRLLVDASGQVVEVELVQSGGAVADEVVLRAAPRFRFRPAQHLNQPVAVTIDYAHTFEPEPQPEPAAAPAPAGEAHLSVLQGQIIERGTRKPIALVLVVVSETTGEREWSEQTDDEGRFLFQLPPGTYEVHAAHVDYEKFLQREELAQGQMLSVRYLLEGSDPPLFETVVRTTSERAEVARTQLNEREVKRTPGTFGDPFRVVDALAGVQQPSSLLAMPMVRGMGPGTTGVLLDGVELPALYHLGFGPAVLHPSFIEQVELYSGAYSAAFGGFTGGIVNGTTRFSDHPENAYEVDLSLAQTGGFVRHHIEELGLTTSVAGRVGYPGLVASIAIPGIEMSYWDYQARIDLGTRRLGGSLFVLGAFDELKTLSQSFSNELEGEPISEMSTQLMQHFHQAHLRMWHESESFRGDYRLVGSFQEGSMFGAYRQVWAVQPDLRWRWRPASAFQLTWGITGRVRELQTDPPDYELPPFAPRENLYVREFSERSGLLSRGSLWLEAGWRPHERVSIAPGVRGDVYHSPYGTFGNVDPRLALRVHAVKAEVGDTWITFGAGWFHQPPRWPMQWPGPEFPTAVHGLSGALHTDLGVEVGLGEAWRIDAHGYFNYLDPTYAELSTHPTPQEVIQRTAFPEAPPRRLRPVVWNPRVGRTYGAELTLRKLDTGPVFGWLSYSFTRSERMRGGVWVPYDFERMHRVQLVGSARFPGGWELGARVTFQTGQPVTTAFGYNDGRSASELRFDVRVDKRMTWDDFMLDFYVDIMNVGVGTETLTLSSEDAARYVLPSLGLRAVF